jgi:hypothetical protein
MNRAGVLWVAMLLGGAPSGSALAQEEPSVAHLLEAGRGAVAAATVDASAVWSFAPDGPHGPELAAIIDIPDRDVALTLVFRRNTDRSLPASHLVEASFETGAAFPGGGIRNVPGLLTQLDPEDTGNQLVGASVKIAPDLFLVALNAKEIRRNLSQLRDRPYLGVALVYANGQRAVLSIEKGETGNAAFMAAFAEPKFLGTTLPPPSADARAPAPGQAGQRQTR